MVKERKKNVYCRWIKRKKRKRGIYKGNVQTKKYIIEVIITLERRKSGHSGHQTFVTHVTMRSGADAEGVCGGGGEGGERGPRRLVEWWSAVLTGEAKKHLTLWSDQFRPTCVGFSVQRLGSILADLRTFTDWYYSIWKHLVFVNNKYRTLFGSLFWPVLAVTPAREKKTLQVMSNNGYKERKMHFFKIITIHYLIWDSDLSFYVASYFKMNMKPFHSEGDSNQNRNGQWWLSSVFLSIENSLDLAWWRFEPATPLTWSEAFTTVLTRHPNE